MLELITIGVIINTHGNRGEVKIKSFTDFPERFYKMETVKAFKDGKERTLTFATVREHRGTFIVGFKEVADMNEAIELKGWELKVNRDELIELPPDHFYVFDLIGLDVYTIDNEYLGKIDEVIETGANDVYVIKKQGSKDILIPALKKLVKEVNLDTKKMVVELMEGLID